jgi:hypothetical protein
MNVRSFGLSVFFHLAVIAAMFWGGENLVTPPRRPILETVIEPNKTKLVWYHFKADLPNIDSPNSAAKATRALNRSRQIMITESKQGSKSEFVWQPSPVELPKEVKAPNLIALHAAAPPPPAPTPPSTETPQTPKPPVRAFVPPPTTPRPQSAPAAPIMLPAPPIKLPSARVLLPAAPVLEALNAPLPESIPGPRGPEQAKTVRQFVPPPARTQPAAGARSGNLTMQEPPSIQPLGNLNVASINLNSITVPSTLPPGRRPGQLSSAPQTGDSAAASEGSGASVPGLTTRGRNPGNSGTAMEPPAPPPSIPQKTVAYREIMSHPMGSSMSVPLRPGARTIPAGVEQRFHDRPVYTMVIPSPKLPEYAADWILWFSERVIPAEGVSQIRAPIPEKKHVPEISVPYTWGSEADIQIAVVIDENGHIQNPAILKIPSGFPAQFALADLGMWQFKPATRNGVPIAVEVLLDIPFRRITSGMKP